MKAYDTKDIRNVVFLGHGGAGKTTVVEALAYISGITTRPGKVADGNTISDYDKEEQKRKFSISTSIVPIEFKDEKETVKINLLDTPGYFDFVGEVEEAVSVADAAVIVVNCKSGIEPGTRKAWEMCEKYRLPRIFFVTNMDDDDASFRELTIKLTTEFGRSISPLQIPLREDGKFVGYVNVIKQKGRKFTTASNKVEVPVPDYLEKQLETARASLMEAVAETSEELMERYFEGEEFTPDEIYDALRANVSTCSIVPVCMGSGLAAQGMNYLLQCINRYCPAPDFTEHVGKDLATGERFTAKCKADASTSLLVFKTIVDPFIGKYSLFKVITGEITPDTTLYNTIKEQDEKIGKIYIMTGKDAKETSKLSAGDIGALSKLDVTQTGDTLVAQRNAPVAYNMADIDKPYTYMAYNTVTKGDDDKVAAGFAKLLEEDKTLKIVNDSENRQSLVYGIGEQQLDVVKSKLEERYKVKIELSKPKFAYRETLRKKVEVRGKHKKQSGGHGQYGDVLMEFEPSGDLTVPYIFEERVFGGSVPKNYFPAVEKGIQECVLKGPMAGYPVVGVKATLTDGSYHPVDSSEMAFKMASTLAFKEGFMKANPVILEPIAGLKVTVPDSFTGDVMGDLNRRRGRVLGMNSNHHGKQTIEAEIPMSELYGYGTDLRSMTGGIGAYEYELIRYEQAPTDVQNAVIAAAAADED
ncbi:MAG: elongation factor G [Eubacteriales bacterium]|nr:elongation factor G [Eubacteriales bacterium]